MLCATETKLDANVHPSLYALDHFHSLFAKHHNRHGGGVAIYVKDSIPTKRLPHLEVGDFELIWCKLGAKNHTILVCCAYVPPHILADQFSDFLTHSTRALLRQNPFHTPRL